MNTTWARKSTGDSVPSQGLPKSRFSCGREIGLFPSKPPNLWPAGCREILKPASLNLAFTRYVPPLKVRRKCRGRPDSSLFWLPIHSIGPARSMTG